MTMRCRWILAIVAAVIVGTHPTNGQTSAAGAQRPAFRGSVDVVTLNVTVTDGSRHYVTNLERTDFLVLEDGRKQELTYFQRTGLPLALALLIDTSASMEDSLPIAQDAAVGFVRELSPADVASVIDFDSRVEIRQEFTGDQSALERAIRRTAAGGSTSLYNAVYIALKELRKTIGDEPMAEPRRRAIVVLSDGEDTSSLVGFDEVLDLAVRSDTAIYTIGLFGRETPGVRRSQEAPFVLRRFAQQTGGRAFFPVDAKELAAIYGEIKAELASQYSLAYESSNPRRDGQFRRIAVRIERTGVVARARPGYYAPTK
jgi:Ca-activated chloride channel family protein